MYTQTVLCICTGCERLSQQVFGIWLSPDKSPRHTSTVPVCPRSSSPSSVTPPFLPVASQGTAEAFKDEYPNFYCSFPLDRCKQAPVNISGSRRSSEIRGLTPIKMMDEENSSLTFRIALQGGRFMFTLFRPIVLFKVEQASSYFFHKAALQQTAPILLNGIQLKTCQHPKSI